MTAPERIWLQPVTEDYRDGWTWCWHKIDESDVEYVLVPTVEPWCDICGDEFCDGTCRDD